LALFAISVDISGPDGYTQIIDVSNNYALPEDGEYRVVIPPFELPGRYELTIRMKGETLQRELPMYVEVIATDLQSTINTRGEAVPEDSLDTMAANAGIALLVAAMVLLWFLRRRRARRLAVWNNRSRNAGTEEDAPLLKGLRAGGEDRDNLS
jgi:hypothetical protein